MHNLQGQIFNQQSNQEWRELQKISRRKEESFQSDIVDMFSAQQLKSPQFIDQVNYLKVKQIDAFSPRIDFFDNKDMQEDSIADKDNNKELNLEELSATRHPDFSKNQLFFMPKKSSQQNISQLVTCKNESATLGLTKGQIRLTQNLTSNNLNVIMNVKKRLIYDVVPLVLLVSPNNHSITSLMLFRVPIFLKIVNIYRDKQEMEKNLMMILDNFFYIQLINLIVNLFLIGHVIACIWYIVSVIDQSYLDNEHSWIHNCIGSTELWWELYLNSFYWAFTLMATGSNLAGTILEMFFTSIAMIFIITIFGYMVNMIGIILEEMNKLNENKLRDINVINKYMKRKHITKQKFDQNAITKRDLKARVNLDIEYLYLRSMKQKSEDEFTVLQKISPDLQNEIKIEFNKNVISKIKCLMNNFSESTIIQVCLELQEEFYSPNQILFNEEEIGDSSLIFLVSGQIDLFQSIKYLSQKENDKLTSDKQIKGSVFGELNFFTGMGREYTAKSKQFSTVLKLRRESFLNIIKNNPQDFEKFCEIKDKILIYSDYSPIQQVCQICQSCSHFESGCPLAHFNQKNPFLFAKFNYSVFQERQFSLNRKKNQKVRIFSSFQQIQEKAEQIQQNYDLQSLQNPDEFTEQASVQDDDDDDDDEDDEDEDTIEKSSLKNEEVINSKMSALNNQEKDLEIPSSPEQQITYTASKFSLLNGFTTMEDKTRKTSQSNYRNEIQAQSPKDSQFKVNLQEDNLSINILNSFNNQTNTPKAISRGVTQYQSSAERTEFTAFMKEMNQQDSVKEQEFCQKENFKKGRSQKTFQDNKRRYSVKTDYSKKKIKNPNIRRLTYFENDIYKGHDILHKQSMNNHEITQYEKQVTFNLWNLDGVKTFSNYFPNGNYIPALTKFNQQRKKYLKQNQYFSSDKQKSNSKKKSNQ